jgi:hypothetical protein
VNYIIHGTCGLDSHANKSVDGPNCIVLEYTDQVTSVSAFSPEHDIMSDIPIGTAAMALQ